MARPPLLAAALTLNDLRDARTEVGAAWKATCCLQLPRDAATGLGADLAIWDRITIAAWALAIVQVAIMNARGGNRPKSGTQRSERGGLEGSHRHLSGHAGLG